MAYSGGYAGGYSDVVVVLPTLVSPLRALVANDGATSAAVVNSRTRAVVSNDGRTFVEVPPGG